MSRKTRKLIWSAPLVAVLAVAVMLAIFAVQSPQGAQAQTVEVPGSVEGLKATAKSRNSVELTWGLPKSGDTPTGYRIDHSEDNLVWERLVENTGSTTRSRVVTEDVDTDTRRHYRVFAINEAGTGPVSNDPVTAFVAVADTFPATTPVASTLVLTLSIDPDDSNTVVLKWTKPTTRGAAVTAYSVVEMVDADDVVATARIECADDSVCLEATAKLETDTTHKHENLITGSQHYYRVTASSSPQDDIHSNVVGITLGTLGNPDAPTGLVAVPENGGVELYWIGPARNGGHALAQNPLVQSRSRATSSATWSGWNPVTGGTGGVTDAFNFMIPSVVDGQWQYQVRVQQNNDPGDSGLNKMSSWSRRSTTIISPVPATGSVVPLIPELMAEELVVESRREQGIGLTWTFDTTDTTPANTPSNYRIDRSKDGLVWEVGQRNTAQLKQWNDKGRGGLTKDDTWHYRLFPINGNVYGQADYATADVREADIPASSLVFSMTAVGISQTAIKLDWTKPAATHDSFDVYMAEPDAATGRPPATGDNGAYAELTSVAGNITTYTHDEGLGPEENRWYRVVAIYEGDAIADGPEALGTTLPAGNPDTGDGATGTPIDLTAEEAKDSSFELAEDRGVLLLWNKPVETGKFNHTNFTVQRKVDDGDWETIEEYTDGVSTHYTDEEEPVAGEQRAYRVQSRSVKGQSAWSNVAYYPAMTGMAQLPLGDASDLMATPNADGSIALEWTPAPNATHNFVYGTDGPNSVAWAYAMVDDMHTVPAADLTDGTSYTFYVIAGQWTEVTEGTWEGEWAPGGWTGPAMATAMAAAVSN